MCTLSLAAGEREGDWTLFFNRDEARGRAPELPPTEYVQDGVLCVAPTDRAAGGTWITANELGLSAALLNGYVETQGLDRGNEFRTRGELVRQLGAAADRQTLESRLRDLDLSYYRPFVLFAVDAEAARVTFTWDGETLVREMSPELPLASSAAVQEEAKSSRRALYQRCVGTRPTAEALDRFHRSHEPERGALSPCMHRSDAATRSLIRIDKSDERITMRHEAGPPCEPTESTSLSLSLRKP
ncbi:MAG: NRDE family protein [Planctomycetota bacterium]